MTPQFLTDKLREIHTGHAGNAVVEMKAEEQTLVLTFLKALAERKVAFPSQASKVLYDGLRYLLKRE